MEGGSEEGKEAGAGRGVGAEELSPLGGLTRLRCLDLGQSEGEAAAAQPRTGAGHVDAGAGGVVRGYWVLGRGGRGGRVSHGLGGAG